MSLTAVTAKLAAAKSVIASGSLAGILAFVISETVVQNFFIAGVLSAVCSVAVALIRSRPAVITARAGAEASAVAEWAALLSRTTEIFEAQLSRLREKNDRQEKKEALMRVTKHNIGGAYQAAVFHVQALQKLCSDNSLTFPTFTPQTIKDLTRVEDDETLKLFNLKPIAGPENAAR